MEIPLKKINFTLIGIILSIIVTLLACSTTTNNLAIENDSMRRDSLRKDSLRIDSLRKVSLRKELRNCIPEDTTLAKTDMSIKYVIEDTTYAILIQIRKTKKLLGYGFNCEAPPVIIPRFEWANKNILALIRGCGSYCSVSYYYQIRNDTIQELERQNVLWHDKKANLIAYENHDNAITLENIYTKQKEKYELPDGQYNSLYNMMETEFRLRGNIFSIKFPIEKNGKEVEYYREIVLSKRLIILND